MNISLKYIYKTPISATANWLSDRISESRYKMFIITTKCDLKIFFSCYPFDTAQPSTTSAIKQQESRKASRCILRAICSLLD